MKLIICFHLVPRLVHLYTSRVVRRLPVSVMLVALLNYTLWLLVKDNALVNCGYRHLRYCEMF